MNPNPEPEMRQTTIACADLPVDEADGLIELGRACRMSPADARAVLVDVADALGGWREVASENGVPQSQLARFEDSFSAGLRTLRNA